MAGIRDHGWRWLRTRTSPEIRCSSRSCCTLVRPTSLDETFDPRDDGLKKVFKVRDAFSLYLRMAGYVDSFEMLEDVGGPTVLS